MKEEDGNVEKKQELVEDDIEPASFIRIVKNCAPEWYFLTVGVIAAAVVGAFPIVFSTLLSGLISVSMICC